MVGVVGPSVGDVVEDVLSVHAVTLGDGEETDGTESALGVDVEALALSSLHVDGELWMKSTYEQRVNELQPLCSPGKSRRADGRSDFCLS